MDEHDSNVRLTFAEHQNKMASFVDECTVVLREIGLYPCEAQLFGDWEGRVLFVRHAMTTGTLPTGHPMVLTARAFLPIPWLAEEAGQTPPTTQDLMKKVLVESEQALAELASRSKVLRLSVEGYSDRCGRRVQVAQSIVSNGAGANRGAIVIP